MPRINPGLLVVVLVVLACTIGPGCQTVQPRTSPVAAPSLPEGAPEVAEIVGSLAQNDSALRNFRAAGTFTIESPKLKAVQRFPLGTVAYRRPADLHVVGKNKLNLTEFRLISKGAEFLIEFPIVQDVDDRYYYSFEGEQFANVPFSVSPADIANEMFMPVQWDAMDKSQIRFQKYDESTGAVTLALPDRGGAVRTLTVEGTPWRIVQSTLVSASGDTLCETTMREYTDTNGIRMPAFVESWFPGEQTRLTFAMRNIRVNLDSVDLPESLFTIKWRPGQ